MGYCHGARRWGKFFRFPEVDDGGDMKVWLFMRVGYPRRITGSYLLAGKDYDRILGREIYDEVVDFLRGVESYGFDGIFFPEHHSRAVRAGHRRQGSRESARRNPRSTIDPGCPGALSRR